MARRHSQRRLLAAAGAAGALLWALQQPLDKRVARFDYDDVELLGKAVIDGPAWRPVGLAMHAANGALFGLAYSELHRRTPRIDPRVSAQAFVQLENFGLFPLTALVDRFHPRRGELPRLWFSPRALVQATWRHAILGIVLGEVARRSDAPARAARQ